MTNIDKELEACIVSIAAFIEQGKTPPIEHYSTIMSSPKIATCLVKFMGELQESQEDDPIYVACVFAVDFFASQVQIAIEAGSKNAEKKMAQFMQLLARSMATNKHSLVFWGPFLNVFYDMHIELSAELKDAYLNLADSDTHDMEHNEFESGASALRKLLEHLSHLSVFDLAEHLFAQSYAMPVDFFADLVFDLYSMDVGREVAPLLLLHPNHEVREAVVAELDILFVDAELTPDTLSRLQAIKNWYPESYHHYFDKWILQSRKQGVMFLAQAKPKLKLKASEVDGGGAQGIFICIDKSEGCRISSVLLKQGVGVKDCWITQTTSKEDAGRYFNEVFKEHITLRNVELDYIKQVINHFLAITLENEKIPAVQLLELQEALGCQFKPVMIDAKNIIADIAVQITPFTQDVMQNSLRRSKNWLKTRKLADSWFIENANVDKLVNLHAKMIDGIKICNVQAAVADIIGKEFEEHRQWWEFHFLWMVLWAKSNARKNETLWLDCFFIAYAINTGMPLMDVPLIQEIALCTARNSMETMQERRTYLS